jgi:molybdopterin-guanine dinucleotide biosynthesis adapter protein
LTIPVLSIIGKSGSGKTVLLEKIIPELKRRGYRVATIKHHFHPGFEIDIPGKDTWRHAQAGSDQVIIAGPDRIASIRRLERELALDEIIERLIAPGIPPVDIILTEGFKRAGKPALEVVRLENGLELISGIEQLVAVAADTPLEVAVPQFNLNDATQIVDFIENRFLKGSKRAKRSPK